MKHAGIELLHHKGIYTFLEKERETEDRATFETEVQLVLVFLLAGGGSVIHPSP